jgi:hypothetical protein
MHFHQPWRCMLSSCQLLPNTFPGSPEALTEEIQDTARVAPLVVVPGDKLDEMVVESNACLSIKDGGVRVTVEISGNDFILGVSQDA